MCQLEGPHKAPGNGGFDLGKKAEDSNAALGCAMDADVGRGHRVRRQSCRFEASASAAASSDLRGKLQRFLPHLLEDFRIKVVVILVAVAAAAARKRRIAVVRWGHDEVLTHPQKVRAAAETQENGINTNLY